MWFLYCFSWLSILIQVFLAFISVASGMYYLAELVEEYSVLAKKIIIRIIIFVISCHVGLLLFEDLPSTMLACGILGQIMHLLILKTFPYVEIKSPFFACAVILLIVNHYIALQFFTLEVFAFSEVIAYFTICLWLVPFLLSVSLSANDYVLPTTMNSSNPLLDDSDVVTKYFSKKNKKYGLLPLFNYMKDSILPERNKKVF